MTHDVLVSYPNVDRATADAIVNSLEAAGIRCWVAHRDVLRGADWAAAIVQAIGAARMLVLVFSDGTNSSDHILREVRAAGDAGIPILPFRTTEADPTPALQYYIGGTHWLDAMSESLQEHLDELVPTVESILAGDHRITSPPRTSTPRSRWDRFSPAARVGIGAVAVSLAVAVGVGVSSLGDSDRSATPETPPIEGSASAEFVSPGDAEPGSARITGAVDSEFIVAESFAPDTDVSFDVVEPDGRRLWSGTFYSDENGGVFIDTAVHGVDLIRGMTVIVGDGTNRKELVLNESLTVEYVDLATGNAGGSAPASVASVWPGIGSHDRGDCNVGVVVIDGDWTLDFLDDPCVAALPSIDYVTVAVTDDDGDVTVAHWNF